MACRVVLAAGRVADLALDDRRFWIGPSGLVARRAVDANGDGRDEGFVTSTGGASNDADNLFGLAGCQLRQVRIAGATSGSFVAAPDDPRPPELRASCGSGAW